MGGSPVSRETAEAMLFGDRLPDARRYAEILASTGVLRGLIGPREVPRLWDRHLLNCAVVADLIPPGAAVCDVGSGAGLPGIPLALRRPDLSIELVEPMLRRATFLTETVRELELTTTTTVTRSRAELLPGRRAEIVTARAVAPLAKLARWCLPLVAPGGSLLALKGEQADTELAAAEHDLRRLGATGWSIEACGRDLLPTPTTVVRIVAGLRTDGRSDGPRREQSRGRRR
jgi:16S rRNA (guanine527-N7)-methyltransferase